MSEGLQFVDEFWYRFERHLHRYFRLLNLEHRGDNQVPYVR